MLFFLELTKKHYDCFKNKYFRNKVNNDKIYIKDKVRVSTKKKTIKFKVC